MTTKKHDEKDDKSVHDTHHHSSHGATKETAEKEPPKEQKAAPAREPTIEEQLHPVIERLEKLCKENPEDVAYSTIRGHLHSARRWAEDRTQRYANQANVERK